MQQHLLGILDTIIEYLTMGYRRATRKPTEVDRREQMVHNSKLIEHASALDIVEYVDLNGLTRAKPMWHNLLTLQGGDEYVLKPMV